MVVLIGFSVAFWAGLFWFFHDLPSPLKLKSGELLSISTQIFDRNGKLLYEIFADENRSPVRLQDLPWYVPAATVAIEDQRFYEHHGLDFYGIARAALRNMFGSGNLQGGSTLTQQLVKVTLLTRERTLERKAKEAVLTLAVEFLFDKDEILEMYLNSVPYGGTSWGIEAAAQTFFDKPAKDLTLAEATFLTGLPQSPSRYSPFGNTPELGRERQKEVLRRLREEGKISSEEERAAAQEDLAFARKNFTITAPHFVFYVRDQLIEEYGQNVVERGGLRVTTTLDLDVQNLAQATVSAEVADLERMRVSNGSALVMKPNTGEILAMVGSRDYFNATAEGKINMTTRPRQPGSTLKPLGMAAAFSQRRANPATMLLDIPTCFEQIGSSPYCPKNYDGSYRGPLLPRQALANSYNIPAVKIGALLGLEGYINALTSLGIGGWRDLNQYGPSVALGASETSMLDLATAFGTMANSGVYVPPVAIRKIETYDGEVLFELDDAARAAVFSELQKQGNTEPADQAPIISFDSTRRPRRALEPQVTWLVSEYLSDNQARSAAFGTNSSLFIRNQKVAAKTGTTNDLRDNWTVGYTPQLVVATWVGNNNNQAMNQRLVSGVTGAAPIWNGIMKELIQQTPPNWPEKPVALKQASFCKRSGLLPNPATPADRACEMATEWFWEGTEPKDMENVWRGTWVAGQTGLPPKADDPIDQLKFEEHVILNDPFTRDYCQTCTRATIPSEDATQPPKPIEEKYFVTAERLFILESGYQQWEEEAPPPAGE